jgi:HK97 family phage major capsid protein
LVSTVAYSRQLLQQGTPDVEAFLRKDLARAVAVAIDRAAIQGSGTEGQPVGLLKHANVPVIPIGTNGGVPTADAIYALEESVALANFEMGGFLTTAQIRRLLRKTPQFTNATEPLWDAESGGLIGYPSFVSTNCPATLSKGTTNGSCHLIAAGDWSQMVIGTWWLELTADQFAQKRRGLIELTVHTGLDVIVLRDTAFALVTDATLT